MPLCYSPWTNIDISPLGVISPCCKFTNKDDLARFNIRHHTIQHYRESQFLKDIKQQMANGDWPKQCERCHIEEKNDIPSKRQLDYNRWHEHYDQYDLEQGSFITASIAFGNTCNLKCITCGPESSSRWQKEHSDIFGTNTEAVEFYRRDFADSFALSNPNIVHIDIPGGEPFLSGIIQQKQMLSGYIKSGQSRQISLHYTTNATVYPDDSWWDLWQHFRELDLQISADGVDKRFEYIRFPADWNQFSRNVEHYIRATAIHRNLRLSVSHTVSAYNVFYLDEFFEWCSAVGLPKPWLGRVHQPEHMRPAVWPTGVRSIIAKKLHGSQHDEVRRWGGLLTNEDDSEYFEKFLKMLHTHDAYRALNFKNIFPEMAQYL